MSKSTNTHEHFIGLLCLSLLVLLFHAVFVVSIDYGEALTKSILYYEAQRSGKLPDNQRVQWRADSSLNDGKDVGVDLVGGYHDAGDNVKFGFPMAYTITMLSWSVIEYESQLSAKNELLHALEAIKWGTDYLIKAHPQSDVLYGQVGDGQSDHECWERPEDMTTSRTSFKIDAEHPGSDLAGETSAALAAASIVFQKSDSHYSNQLLDHAKQLFEFARNHQGLYQNSIPSAGQFYPSSGFQDELLWAAAWLHRATDDGLYLDFLGSAKDIGGVRTMFSWDDKFVGAQVLVAKLTLESQVEYSGIWTEYESLAEQFICSVIQKGNNNVKLTTGGLLWWQPWNDLQYATSAIFIATVYSDYLRTAAIDIECPSGDLVNPDDLIKFIQSQVDYILGSNPKSMSYMVGIGSNYPVKVHHRGASIISIKKDKTPVTCKGGYDTWFNKDAPNPNVLEGAVVGGPDLSDSYQDSRSNYQQAEPAIANTAPLVGVLARLA